MEDKIMDVTEMIEVPKDWDAEINLMAKRWLRDTRGKKICPAKAYLGLSPVRVPRKYCRKFCFKLFPGTKTSGFCPCDALKLEEVKDRVKKVTKQWEIDVRKEIEEVNECRRFASLRKWLDSMV